jgi:beta-phosphoglucomutase-like phosphatase (HAD superfamily)
MKTALLFDLDGTLVDSDPEHLVAFQRVFAPHGIELDHSEYSANIMGASNAMIASRYLSHLSPLEQAAALDAKEADYRENLGALEPILGALALLDFADRRGLKRAVVTNAPRANAEKVLAALGIGQHLPILVIGSELARSKPDPLPYLTGARTHRRAGGAFDRLRGFVVGRSRCGRGGPRRGGHDDNARFANADRGRRDVRREQFHRSAHL